MTYIIGFIDSIDINDVNIIIGIPGTIGIMVITAAEQTPLPGITFSLLVIVHRPLIANITDIKYINFLLL